MTPHHHLYPQRAAGTDNSLTHLVLIDVRWWSVASDGIQDKDDIVERRRKLEAHPRAFWGGRRARLGRQPLQPQCPSAAVDGVAQ